MSIENGAVYGSVTAIPISTYLPWQPHAMTKAPPALKLRMLIWQRPGNLIAAGLRHDSSTPDSLLKIRGKLPLVGLDRPPIIALYPRRTCLTPLHHDATGLSPAFRDLGFVLRGLSVTKVRRNCEIAMRPPQPDLENLLLEIRPPGCTKATVALATSWLFCIFLSLLVWLH